MQAFEKRPEKKPNGVERGEIKITQEISQAEREVLRTPTLEQAKQTLAELAANNLIYLDSVDLNNVPEVRSSYVLIFYTRTSEISAVEHYIKGQQKLLCDIRAIPESEYHLYSARPRGANPGESWYGWFIEIEPNVVSNIKPKQEVIGIPVGVYRTEQNSHHAGQEHATGRPVLTEVSVQDALKRYKKISPRAFNSTQASELETLINNARTHQNKRHAA